ncbi:MAG: transketolase [Candidatus Shapirobacteria bacterium]|nr:transketolase [Candidatus Shapirobacteria bacterium]
MSNLPVPKLEEKAKKLRRQIIFMINQAGSGHIGGSFSSLDILVALFFGGVIRYNCQDCCDPRRDRFILSCGHVCPAYYAVLAECGLIDKKELVNLRALGSSLQGHPSKTFLPLLDSSSGSLGQGLSVAVGRALAAKLKKEHHCVYCLTSDGEHDEGSTWEAVLTASHHRLGNLVNIIDRNGMQIGGETEKILSLDPLAEKYKAFGWRVFIVNGHDYNELLHTICQAKDSHREPSVIIARTTLGKGVSFMENKKRFHSGVLSKEECQQAMKELGGKEKF